MKKILTIIGSLLLFTALMAQSPESFKYQAVLRDARGNIKANTSADILIDILEGGANGTSVYSESHKVTTDGFGLFNLELGKGKSPHGDFSAINWGAGIYFVKVTVDEVVMGTGQLLSVPYALYATKSANGFSGDYNELTNKPVLFDGTWQSLSGKPSLAVVATSGDYNDLINKPVTGNGTVTFISATAPISVVSGTTTPVISMMQASGSANGYLSSTDWTTFNNKSSFDGTWSGLAGKPSLAPVATSGVYQDLSNKPTGNNLGEMQYWNGSDWVMLPIGEPGQYLQMSAAGIPAWMGAGFPTMTSDAAVSAITMTTATLGGEITGDGGSVVTDRGICWSTSEEPTVADNKTSAGTGSGPFTGTLTGLVAGTTYYTRTYATNSAGTTYGDQLSFTTLTGYTNMYLSRDDATTGYVTIANSTPLATTFSYDLWVKPTRSITMAAESNICSGDVSVPLANSNQNWAILATAADYNKMSVGLTIGTNGLMVGEHSQYVLVSRLSYTVPINDWVHVAIVYRSDSIFLFLNGSLVRSRQIPCPTNIRYSSGVLAGARYSPEFKGDIDEFRLWDIPLTRQQVQIIKDKKLMNQVTGLRFYASFDDGKFERALGDYGDVNMTVVGLSPALHIKTNSWSLDRYTGSTIGTLTPY
jgi:hypothetical protein